MATAATCESGGAPELAPAGIIGRIGKFLIGSWQLYAVYMLVTNPGFFAGPGGRTHVTFWIVSALALALLSWTLNLGFRRGWGKRPFWVASAVIAVAICIDFVLYGDFWGMPLAVVLLTLSIYVHGHMGFCHVLASILATPGCEMRAPAHLAAMVSRSQAKLAICPGIWSKLDAWEARLRERRVRKAVW